MKLFFFQSPPVQTTLSVMVGTTLIAMAIHNHLTQEESYEGTSIKLPKATTLVPSTRPIPEAIQEIKDNSSNEPASLMAYFLMWLPSNHEDMEPQNHKKELMNEFRF